jgi:hypothetical protein
MGPDLGFSLPESWYPENEIDVEATKRFESVVRSLVANGHKVDCVDRWEGATTFDIDTLNVEITKLPEDYFRFIENYRFEFR